MLMNSITIKGGRARINESRKAMTKCHCQRWKANLQRKDIFPTQVDPEITPLLIKVILARTFEEKAEKWTDFFFRCVKMVNKMFKNGSTDAMMRFVELEHTRSHGCSRTIAAIAAPEIRPIN